MTDERHDKQITVHRARERDRRVSKLTVTPQQRTALCVLAEAGSMRVTPRGFMSEGEAIIPYRTAMLLVDKGLAYLHQGRSAKPLLRITVDGSAMLTPGEETPPRPWSWKRAQKANGSNNGYNVHVIDARGRTILSVYGRPLERETTARMIVDLVNRSNQHG